jgi:DNA-binding transcriptional ArsR family regulator
VTDALDRVFAALADPTRRQLVVRLQADGPMSATELAGGTDMSRQAIVKHLQVLDEAGLVAGERAGRAVLYRVTPGPLTDATAWLVANGARWDRRLERLRAHLAR